MKRIILLLALLSLGVSKAQIVGGYLPLNSTKTATMGGLKVAGNETVTGTFSVGSTATITGALKASSTMSLGSANLTGGNTGTVAVLSDALFPVTMKTSALGQSPADGQTYYFANIQFPNFSTEQGNGKIYFPYNVTLVGWTANFYVGTILGSAENSTLQINIDNSATNLSTAITMSALAQTYTNTGLSINVNANSYVEAKLITPTWATNPTNVFAGIIFWFVRRS